VAEQVEHSLNIAKGVRQLKYPGGKDGMWVASCVCNRYTCQPQKSPGQAVHQVNLHIEGKTGK